MLIKVLTIEELKRDFEIAFRNNCGDKVTKYSDLSVINGFSYAISKLVQKINKNAAQIESKLFPENANSIALDEIANREGISPRGTGTKSSTILLFKAEEGTVYPQGTMVKTASGITFQTTEELVIGSFKYGFVFSESILIGKSSNVLPNTLVIMVSEPPQGHISVTNLAMAVGGTDEESDYEFRKRIMSSEFLLSRNTESFYEALIYKINKNVLRVKTKATSSLSKSFTIILVKNSLSNFTQNELDEIKEGIQDNLPLSDRNNTKINITNINWTYIDVYVPIKKKQGFNLKDILIDMQIGCANYLDLSKWEFGQKVDWATIYEICSKVDGVDEIIDVNFLPKSDLIVSKESLPRIRMFTVYDVDNQEQEGEQVTPEYFIQNNIERDIYLSIIP